MTEIVARRFVVFMVGIDMQQQSVNDAIFSVGDPANRIVFAVRGFRDFDEAIGMLGLRPDMQLVHVANEVELPRLQLVRECENLARAMALHGASPWVNFADRKLNFLTQAFRSHGIRVYEGSQDHHMNRWVDIVRARGNMR